MDKGLQEIIAKLKSQNPQVSQNTKPSEKVVNIPPKKEDVTTDDMEDDAEFFKDDEEKKSEEKPIEVSKIAQEMELLQNNGRFRAELLFQLQELVKTNQEIVSALTVLAKIQMQR